MLSRAKARLSEGILSELIQTRCTCGLSVRRCTFVATPLVDKLCASLRVPATPAVDSVWPILPLILLVRRGLPSSEIADIALTSIGSPKAVPVP